MNYIIRLFVPVMAALALAGCGNEENDEPQAPQSSVFEAEFIDLYPVIGEVTDMYVTHQVLTNILELCGGTKTEVEETYEATPRISKSKTVYRLELYPTSAKLTLKVTDTESTGTYRRTGFIYNYREGRYEIPEETYGDYVRYMVITSEAIMTQAWNTRTDTWSEPYPLCPLDNFRFNVTSSSLVSETEKEHERQEETMLFDAVTDPNGVVALRNGEYTYNFIPSTGRLVMLEPEYKEIGNLDRIP